ncbi:ABC transporter permease [Williamwhitmania taraxaci]|uniref:Putative ABC transport system permease protein n=1 Tax=Williamwhitmania taraxaci TaxID=1640674 RepID=A0A1G6RPY6_9BACT|nr:ABC transporter permease [Williamwhitmania taraxaci]SDD06483.1 putative ABC transport system permease protein [Williamwhitmania taraxaci]
MIDGLIKRYLHDFQIAFESILSNKFRSFLTALGIIFGVAAVISMLAIGNGAKQEILEQIKMVGVNNIVITPIIETQEEQEANSSGQNEKNKYSPGLTLADAEAIKAVVPSVKVISPEIVENTFVIHAGMRVNAKIIGVGTDYFSIYNLPFETGHYFTDYQSNHGLPVCVIGSNVASKLFSTVDPIGKWLKFGNVWLKVIGVLKKNQVSITAFENVGVNVYNDNIFIPVKTMLNRYKNRALVNMKTQSRMMVMFSGGGMSSSSSKSTTAKNYNQLDKLVVQVTTTEDLSSTVEVLSRLMLRRHQGVKDFEITIPEMLLKQQQRTKDIFNIVLGAIASISLVVGGIGIMNIMFASVMERIKEIGTRLAIGAKKMDIVVQFLSEAVLISVTGGFIGVILGVVISVLISHFAGIKTEVSGVSIVVAFGVSVAVGIIFGYSPAKRAAERDPIESLRYE